MKYILDDNLRIEAAEEMILQLCDKDDINKDVFFQLRRKNAKQFAVSMITNNELTKSYHKMVKNGKISKNKNIENLIRLKNIRSLSGIVVVSILTKPYDCPGKCLYCPSQENLPKSYMKNEPAVMRAILNGFDPYKQTQNRLESLSATGHPLDKINIRIIGGTWSYYPKQYQTWFIKRVFEAANSFAEKSQIPMANDQYLDELQKINEAAACRLVEISVETRQDYIDDKEIRRLRELGVTKVELGIQSIYDDVLKLNRRGHDVACSIEATKILKDAGFKVAYQVMLNLAGADFERDKNMLVELFSNPDFRPDYLKIYPLAMVKEAPIYELYKKGGIKMYDAEQLSELIGGFKTEVAPKYLRIERIIRDIPSQDIVEGGAKISNLRQIIQDKMKKEGKTCQCIRCREIKDGEIEGRNWQIFREDYEASGGKEIFLSIESEDRSTLISILRLRIPSGTEQIMKVLNNAGIIREMHTYGAQVSIDHKNIDAAQHRGYGKMLLKEAQKIAKEEFGLTRMAIISGVGARNYFRKFGYELDDTYMTRALS